MSLTYEQFVQGDAITNGIEDIRQLRNFAYGYSDHWGEEVYWWVEVVAEDVYLYSAPDFTTAKFEEHASEWTGYVTTNVVIDTIILRVNGNNMVYVITGSNTYGGNDWVWEHWVETSDFTINAPTFNDNTNAYLVTAGYNDVFAYDIYFGSTIRRMIGRVHSGVYTVLFTTVAGAIDSDTVQVKHSNKVYAGWNDPDSDDYFFVYQNLSDDLILAKYDGTAVTTEETLTISVPTTWDAEYQQYWRQEGTEMLVDRDYFRNRPAALDDFSEYAAASPSDAICMIWSFDNIEINYIIWGDYIWEWTEGGAIERLMVYDDSTAYIGYNDWFSDGTYLIQIDTTVTFAVNSGELLKESMRADQLTNLFSSIQPFTNQFLKLYLEGNLLYMGRVEKDKNDFTQYEYIMKSGMAEDFEVKITESFTTKTINYIVKTVIGNNFEHIWDGRGTNGDVISFDSSLTDWTDSDDGSCATTYLAQKTFYNAYSEQNEIFTDLMKMVDANAAGKCEHTYAANYSVFSIWVFPTDKTIINNIIGFNEAATQKFYITFNASAEIRLVGTADTLLQSYDNNYGYHIVMVANATANTVSVYINGTLSTADKAVTAFTQLSRLDLETTDAAQPTCYWSEPYFGDSLPDSMNTLDSLSPLNTDTFTKSFSGAGFKQVLKWAARYGGYVAAFTPDYQLYLGANNVSGEDVNENGVADSYGYRERKIEELREKFSLVRIYGGYVDGAPLESVFQGEPAHGYWQDTFANVTVQAELDAMILQIVADKNVEIVVLDFYLTGKSIFRPGTSFTFTSSIRSYTAEVFNVTRVGYNIKTGEQSVYSADSYWLPDAIKKEEERFEKVEDRVDQNEQNIGAIANEVAAGAPDHNALGGLNDGDVYEHISQAQKDLLHATYTNANAVTAMGVKGDANPLHHDQTPLYTDANALAASIAAEAFGSGWNGDTKGPTKDSLWDFLSAAFKIGSANAAWQGCVYLDHSGGARDIRTVVGYWSNVGSNDVFTEFMFPLPLTLGSLTLHIKGLRYYLKDADSNDYITATNIYGFTSLNAQGTVMNNNDNQDAADIGLVEFDNTDFVNAGVDYDTTGKSFVIVAIQTYQTTTNELDVGYPELEYYYDT